MCLQNCGRGMCMKFNVSDDIVYNFLITIIFPFDSDGRFSADDVPDSCCKNFSFDCGKGFQGKDINEEGCWTTIENEIERNSKVALGIGIGVVVVLIIVAVASCRVAKKGYH